MVEEVSSKKKGNNTFQEKEMSFWEHLEELRWRIVRSFLAVLVFAVVAFLNRRIIFDNIILAPKDSEFITNQLLCKLAEFISVKGLCIDSLDLNIINITMSGQFMTHMYISIVAGLIFATPYILWEIWRFVTPALKSSEKKYSGGTVAIMSLLFFIGVLFSYFLIVPLTLNFLGTYQVSEDVLNKIALRSYIGTVVTLSFGVGAVFELPVFIFFLTKIGIVTPSFLKKNRKYALVIVLILSAIITPADVFSQIMVAIPLLGLYEVGILVSKRVFARQSKLSG